MPDFTFLTEDVRRQREIAERTLDEAKKLNALLSESSMDPKIKAELEKTKETLINLARGLAVNATSTSSSAAITLGYLN